MDCIDQLKYKFGFDSYEQLSRWFTKNELMRLEEAGFFVTRVEAKEVIGSDYQVIFIEAEWKQLSFPDEALHEIIPF